MVEDVKFAPENPDDEDSKMVAKLKGITFVELSLVAVPADPNAGFAKAICEAFDIKDKDNNDSSNLNTIDSKLEKENEKMEAKKLAEKIEDQKNTLEELQSKEEALKEEIKSLEIKALEKKRNLLKEDVEKEDDKTNEEDKKPVEDKTVGDVDNGNEETSEDDNKTEDKNDNIMVEKGNNGISLSYDALSSNLSSFKRC